MKNFNLEHSVLLTALRSLNSITYSLVRDRANLPDEQLALLQSQLTTTFNAIHSLMAMIDDVEIKNG